MSTERTAAGGTTIAQPSDDKKAEG